ncbi:MAG: DUF1365 domain-containing protein [Pseudomonadota bacterium]
MRPAGRLFRGHVMHMRLQPRRHQFRYRVFSLLLDIDQLHHTLRGLRLLRLDRFGLFSIHIKDHGPRDGSPLRPWVDAQLAKADQPRAARVEMLSFPRMLGYGFNPLTVYYCYDAGERLTSLIYEVKNTFGDQVAYTLRAGDQTGGAYRQTQVKQMYVSPFIGMDQVYRFAHNAPEDRLALRIRQAGPEGETLIATHTAQGRPLTDRALAHAFLAYPMMTFSVIALIHWNALRLALKRVRYHSYSKSDEGQKSAA